ncbi:MAG TPA: type 4a pilus biogenesis protein PilO [Candidatus Sumerlaeota bacterium]|nr:type 4a pilus biogenesis protein PilO [Candidatus Sumerlaeota bacterium]HOR26875.1 type 4a pilus biogenesis protein PilO [Candidatus Sumerlaeota bacterium]HPK01907.1 type 4a pilus biogenesis protein PilO [Candidatus Sumerlaeota bacterium]
MSDQQKTALLVTVFVGLVGLILIAYFHFMIGRGMINKYERRTRDMVEETKELEVQLAEIRSLLSQKDELEKQAEMIEKVTRRLPDSPDAPGFLNALVMILGTTGIIQEEVKPDKNTARALYTEIPYSVKAHGHYHAFGQFLTLVEQNPDRFMRLKKLTIGNNAERPSVHPIEMEITTFMFNN